MQRSAVNYNWMQITLHDDLPTYNPLNMHLHQPDAQRSSNCVGNVQQITTAISWNAKQFQLHFCQKPHFLIDSLPRNAAHISWQSETSTRSGDQTLVELDFLLSASILLSNLLIFYLIQLNFQRDDTILIQFNLQEKRPLGKESKNQMVPNSPHQRYFQPTIPKQSQKPKTPQVKLILIIFQPSHPWPPVPTQSA